VPEPATATLRAKHFVSFGHELSRDLPLALFGPADDVAVSAERVTRHAPDIDCGAAANRSNANGRRVRGSDIPPAIPQVTEYGDPADLDVDVLWHVDIDVPAGEQQGYGRARLVHHGVAQVKVEIAKDRGTAGPPA